MATRQSVHLRRDAGLPAETGPVPRVVQRKGNCPIQQIGAFILMWATLALFNVALSEHLSWRQKSLSYDVFLGVVPAGSVRQNENLGRLHGMNPYDTVEHGPSTYHVLVTVFRPSGTQRVVDASVVAEIVENDLIHVKRTKKPLNIMSVDGAETYCNFFDLHWNGKYRVHVNIHEPGKGSENVIFLQEVRGLPK